MFAHKNLHRASTFAGSILTLAALVSCGQSLPRAACLPDRLDCAAEKQYNSMIDAARRLDVSAEYVEAWGSLTASAPLVDTAGKSFGFDLKLTENEIFNTVRLQGGSSREEALAFMASLGIEASIPTGMPQVAGNKPTDNPAIAKVDPTLSRSLAGQTSLSERLTETVNRSASVKALMGLHKALASPGTAMKLPPGYKPVMMVMTISCIPGRLTSVGYAGACDIRVDYKRLGDTPSNARQRGQHPVVLGVYPTFDGQTMELASAYRELVALALALKVSGTSLGGDLSTQLAHALSQQTNVRDNRTLVTGYSSGDGQFGIEFRPKVVPGDKGEERLALEPVTLPVVVVVGLDAQSWTENFVKNMATSYLDTYLDSHRNAMSNLLASAQVRPSTPGTTFAAAIDLEADALLVEPTAQNQTAAIARQPELVKQIAALPAFQEFAADFRRSPTGSMIEALTIDVIRKQVAKGTEVLSGRELMEELEAIFARAVARARASKLSLSEIDGQRFYDLIRDDLWSDPKVRDTMVAIGKMESLQLLVTSSYSWRPMEEERDNPLVDLPGHLFRQDRVERFKQGLSLELGRSKVGEALKETSKVRGNPGERNALLRTGRDLEDQTLSVGARLIGGDHEVTLGAIFAKPDKDPEPKIARVHRATGALGKAQEFVLVGDTLRDPDSAWTTKVAFEFAGKSVDCMIDDKVSNEGALLVSLPPIPIQPQPIAGEFRVTLNLKADPKRETTATSPPIELLAPDAIVLHGGAPGDMILPLGFADLDPTQIDAISRLLRAMYPPPPECCPDCHPKLGAPAIPLPPPPAAAPAPAAPAPAAPAQQQHGADFMLPVPNAGSEQTRKD